jgi:hypothetical protein
MPEALFQVKSKERLHVSEQSKILRKDRTKVQITLPNKEYFWGFIFTLPNERVSDAINSPLPFLPVEVLRENPPAREVKYDLVFINKSQILKIEEK